MLENLRIIGTSHIAKEGIDEIRAEFEKEKPDLVALELDRRRFLGLLHDEKPSYSLRSLFEVGLKGYLFALIGQWAQQKMGKYVGVSPGSEMKTAMALARKENIGIALIDQPLEITLKRFSKELTWKERFRFVWDIISAPFMSRKKQEELRREFDLSKVPSKQLIASLITQVKDRYPNVYKVLIEERNYVMAQNLANIMAKEPEKKIIAVVGAGHEEELLKLVKEKLASKVGKGELPTYSFSVSV